MQGSLLVFAVFISFAVLAFPGLTENIFESVMPGVPRVNYVSGLIKSVDAGLVTVETENGQRQFIVNDEVAVTRNNISSSLASLHQGDDVTITRAPNSEILSVSAVTGTTLNLHSRVLTALPGVALLSFLPYFFRRKLSAGQKIRISYVG